MTIKYNKIDISLDDLIYTKTVNKLNTIKEAMESIINLRYKNIELIEIYNFEIIEAIPQNIVGIYYSYLTLWNTDDN